MTYRPWFELDPEIFQNEREAMEARGFVLNSTALSAKKVEFQGHSGVDPSRPLTVRYPNEYPSLPPSIYSDTPGRYLSRHHHRHTGEICTFGPRRAQWYAERLGTDAIDEAEEIIKEDLAGVSSVAEDDAPEPLTAELGFDRHYALLLPGEFAENIRVDGEERTGSIDLYLKVEKVQDQETCLRGVVTRAEIGDERISAPEYYRKWPLGSSNHDWGMLVVLPEPPSVPRDTKDFYTWLSKYVGRKPKRWTVFLYPDQTIEKGRTQLQGFGIHLPNAKEFKIVKVYQIVPQDRSTRVPGLSALAEKKVLLIGCGAIGSKVAVSLAASGTRRFLLIDGDFAEPGNAVRHEVGAGSFGLPKGNALLKRIHDINPETIGMSEWIHQAIGDVHARVEIDERLQRLASEADLIIDATGVHGVNRYVNNLCQEFKVPGLFVSVTNGAWSGELVRTIPGKTACWMCWDHQYGDIDPPAEPRPSHGVFAPGCNQPTFTGTTYEVGMIANLASGIAVETLLAGEPGRKDVAGDYILWIGRDGAGAPAFKTEIFSVTKRQKCRWCRG